MKNYAPVIAQEVQDCIAHWGDEGELEFVDVFLELTLHTATHCLLGSEFRYKMTDEFKELYRALEAGLQAIAFVDPYMQQPIFKKRDEARARLEQIVSEMVAARKSSGSDNSTEHNDALNTFINGSYSDGTRLNDTEITGLVIATIFAGHHTSSGTATWTLTELARHPEYTQEIVKEIDDIYQDSGELSHASMRDIPKLEAFIDEVLRLHPPLVMLMRRVMIDLEYKDYVIERGKTVCVSTYGSHRNAEYFPDADQFNANRVKPENLYTYIPFGAGRHRCGGNAFATLQLKAIFTALLRHYEFELASPAETYLDDFSGMTLKPSHPCKLRYRRRQ
jgi:sterol 14alpha-demethylase